MIWCQLVACAEKYVEENGTYKLIELFTVYDHACRW